MNWTTVFGLTMIVISIAAPFVRARRVAREQNQRKGIQSSEFRFAEIEKAMKYVAPISLIGVLMSLLIMFVSIKDGMLYGLTYVLIGVWAAEMNIRVFKK